MNRKAGGRAYLQPIVAEGTALEGLNQSTQIGVPYLAHALKSLYATLSPKEQAVALAAARGAEDKEIASELSCTLSTVRTLWQRIYKKTHTTSKRRLISSVWNEACRHCLSQSMSFIERRDAHPVLGEGPTRQGLSGEALTED